MPPVQTTYPNTQPVAVAGMEASMVSFNNVTKQCETDAGIPFGVAVSQGATDDGAIIGGTLAGFIGITIRDITLIQAAANTDKYVDGNSMGVKTRGEIWVTVSEAVVAGGPVHFNATTGVLGDTGGQGPIVGARWTSSAAPGGLAKVSLGIQK